MQLGKISRITPTRIRKISGGKEPSRLVKEFMLRRGFNPDDCMQQRTNQLSQWLVPLSDDEDLEITLEGLNRHPETTLYMGVNVMTVSIREYNKFLHAALAVADTLIDAKLSLVNYDLVLSVTTYTASVSVEDIDYYFELITRQKEGVLEAINEELSN